MTISQPMISTIAIECATLILLFICSAFFSSAETALFSLDAIQIHTIGGTKPDAARRIREILSEPTKLLSALLIGNTMVNVVAAALGFAIVEASGVQYAEAIAIPGMTLLLLIFGEVTPKRLAIRKPEQIAALYAPILQALIWISAPARVLVEYVTKANQKHFDTNGDGLTEDEFLTAVEVSEEEGVLDEDEREMVDGIIRLEETQASDVMTPRVDLVGIDLDDPPASCEATIKKAAFRYLPLYRETLDNIEGLVDVYHYLMHPDDKMEESTIQPFSVPETAPLDTLLATFQREKRRVAVVADEYGGTAGLITRGDILEEIIDYVGDEHEVEKPSFEMLGPNRWVVGGDTSLEDVNYELDLELEAEGADRLAGWVSAIAEHIPTVNEVVRGQGCRATVLRARKSRITLVLLEKLEEEPDELEDD